MLQEASPSTLSTTMTRLSLAFAVAWPLISVSAQSLLPTSASKTFPSCALQCQKLQNAASGCLPPAAPTTDQNTYDSCFCQNADLVGLKNGASSGDGDGGVCDDQCTSKDDASTLAAWYGNYCNFPVKRSEDSKSSSATASQTASNTAMTSSKPTLQFGDKDDGSQWPKKHAGYLAMAIILVVGFTALTIFAVWLRRHIHKKRAAQMSEFQNQGLEAGPPAFLGGIPIMGTNPMSPNGSQPGQVARGNDGVLPGTAISPDDPAKNPVIVPPPAGFTHSPGRRITAEEHAMGLAGESPLSSEPSRGSGRSWLLGRSSRRGNNTAGDYNSAAQEPLHEVDDNSIIYPPAFNSERVRTPRTE